MFGVCKTYEEFVAAAEEAAKRGELWFCPSCSNTNPVMKFCGAYGLKAHYVHCPACCMQGPEVSICSGTEWKAADAWNRLARPVVMSPKVPMVAGWYYRQPAAIPSERNIIYVTETMVESFGVSGDAGRLWGGPIAPDKRIPRIKELLEP